MTIAIKREVIKREVIKREVIKREVIKREVVHGNLLRYTKRFSKSDLMNTVSSFIMQFSVFVIKILLTKRK